MIVMALYLAAGAAFGIVFVARLVDRLDPSARGAGVGFRLLILPGSIALWPILLAKLVRRGAT